MEQQQALIVWLTPAIAALFLYGIGQGLVKKYIADVPPARFCLFFVVAKAVVNLGFYFSQGQPNPFLPESRHFLWVGLFTYILDGAGWILYFKSIVAGPITIVGTLSAAYPALTVLFARVFLSEVLNPIQYVGVALVILGCIGLSYSPPDPNGKKTNKSWIPLAASALILWGASQTMMKYAYRLPGADEASLALLNTIGGTLTLGLFGLLYGRKKSAAASVANDHWSQEWRVSFLPMAILAAGDLGAILASRFGPISIVIPITGAYPIVTLGFAAFVLKEKITPLQLFCVSGILVGIFVSAGTG